MNIDDKLSNIKSNSEENDNKKEDQTIIKY